MRGRSLCVCGLQSYVEDGFVGVGEEGLVERADGLVHVFFVDHEAHVNLACALRDHADVDVRDGGKDAAGNAVMTPNILTYQTDEGFAALVFYVGDLAEVGADCRELFVGIDGEGDGEGENLERLFMERWDNPVTKNRFRLSKGYSLMPYGIEWMKGEPALQAADITAYEMHKSTLTWIKRGLGDMPKDELRKSISSLCRTEHHGLLYRKKELLESFADILADYHNKRKFLQKSQLNQRSNHENEN